VARVWLVQLASFPGVDPLSHAARIMNIAPNNAERAAALRLESLSTHPNKPPSAFTYDTHSEAPSSHKILT
jgi:hypothetical protein